MMENNKLLQIVKWIDDKRWKTFVNYNIISNPVFKLLPFEFKILVHWISYVADRQMAFETVWTKGGQVFSGIVDKYKNYGYDSIKENCFKIDNDKIKFQFNNNVFASRYVSDDLKSILRTLLILDNRIYKRNIILYINTLFNKYHKIVLQLDKIEANYANLIAFILYLLTYHLISKNKSHTISYFLSDTKNYVKIFNSIVNDKHKFITEYQKFIKNRFTGKKRLWCCVRDYLKSPEYRNYFIKGLVKIPNNHNLISAWRNKKTIFGLELPGDTWNLNSVFIDRLVKNNLELKSDNICKELRMNMEKPFYPELFDFSFDFVPRMCLNSSNVVNKSMCKICIFGKNGMQELCHQDSSKLCPITMITCGYIHKCEPNGCPIRDGLGIKLCREI